MFTTFSPGRFPATDFDSFFNPIKIIPIIHQVTSYAMSSEAVMEAAIAKELFTARHPGPFIPKEKVSGYRKFPLH